MGNPHDPVCAMCRREGAKLFLKGNKCVTNCTFDKRNGLPPGQHGAGRKRKLSDYGVQLRAKQRAKRIYGLLETQFRNYFDDAAESKGVTGTVFLQHLERRLDNVVYRLGFGASRRESRQLVSHRHFSVNGRTVNIPSFQVRVGDVVAVREGSRTLGPIEAAQTLLENRPVPGWLSLDGAKLEGRIIRDPEREEMEQMIDEQLIVEYYSR